jgi:predicted NBD/HSP70 family sugar kinase
MTRSAVLACIGTQGPTSRADLARALHVSPALITAVTKELLADGFLVELEPGRSRGGRPARLLGLSSDAGSAVGVKIAADHVTVVEAGVDGVLRRSVTEPFDALQRDPMPALAEVLRGFIDVSTGPLLGVGIGVPGAVDEQGVGVVDSTQLRWHRVPLGDVVREAFGLPVLVENNVSALAVAESLYGQARGHDNVLVVTIGAGVGAGIVIDGVLYRGHAGVAGDFGHIPTLEDGPLCQCGAVGCLETLIGQDALVDEGRRLGLLRDGQTITDLQLLADGGDRAAQDMFSRAGHLFGRALAGVVNVLDPGIVIVLGEGVSAWRHWSYGFEPALRSGLVPRKRALHVAVETWQDDRWAQGAAALVMATPFDSNGVSGEQGRLVRERLTEAWSPAVGEL